MVKGLPLMKNNAATAMPFPLFHPEDKHLMLRLKDTSAGCQRGKSGEMISGPLIVNDL
jgi:hypothetical protein